MRVQDLGKAAGRQLGRFGIQAFGIEFGSRDPAFWHPAGPSMPSWSSKSIFGGRQERKLKIAGRPGKIYGIGRKIAREANFGVRPGRSVLKFPEEFDIEGGSARKRAESRKRSEKSVPTAEIGGHTKIRYWYLVLLLLH